MPATVAPERFRPAPASPARAGARREPQENHYILGKLDTGPQYVLCNPTFRINLDLQSQILGFNKHFEGGKAKFAPLPCYRGISMRKLTMREPKASASVRGDRVHAF